MKYLGNGVLHGGLPTCEKPQVSKQSLQGLLCGIKTFFCGAFGGASFARNIFMLKFLYEYAI
jgi:hypothetical protein